MFQIIGPNTDGDYGILLSSSFAWCQLSKASLSGVIADSISAAIPTAQISATHSETNRVFRAATDTSGRFTFLTLPIGQYEVSAEAKGFKTSQRSIQLTVNQAANLNLIMEVGQNHRNSQRQW